MISMLFVALFISSFLFSCEKQMDKMEDIMKEKNKKHHKEAKLFVAELHPLNNSGVTGKATFKYKEGRQFLAQVHAEGLVPNMVHPQHIHGFEDSSKDAVCPPMSAAGEDGLLELPDGLPFYGPVLVPLDVNLVPLMVEAFPMANANGRINYAQSTELSQLIMAIDEAQEGHQTLNDLNLHHRTVVLHGAFVKDGQIVPAGTEGAEYIATLPVACGEIVEAGNGHDHGDGGNGEENNGGGGNGDGDHDDDHNH